MSTSKTKLAQSLEELEKIVERLNNNDLDIELGLVEFQKGVELVEFCRKELKSAENKFIELKARLDLGTNREEDFVS